MKMQAAVAKADQPTFDVETVEIDGPREDEILVRIAGVGVCHTDLVFQTGLGGEFPLPAVLGHEGSGVVEQVGAAVTKVSAGDRVALSFRSCGGCPRCAAGDVAYCHRFPELNFGACRTDASKAIHGSNGDIGSNFFGQSSFAAYALAYERNVVKLPDDVPLEFMGPLGCGVQTGAGGVMRSLAAEKGSSILILGGGSVGLSAVMGAKIQGCAPIILVEPQASRRELALEFGATHVIDPSAATNLGEAVRAIVPDGVNYAFETTGVPAVLGPAMDCLGPMAVFGIVGVAPPETPLPGDVYNLVAMGHTLKGIIEGDSDPDTFIPELVDHYRAGRLPFDKMIKTYPLSRINEAVADQHHGKCVKVVLLPDG